MARISTLTTGTPASTSALVGNVGANTRSFDVEELLSVPITATGDLLIGDSSNFTTRLAAGSSKEILGLTTGVPDWLASTVVLAGTLGAEGDILVVSSDGVEALNAPSSGAVLVYSTVDGSVGPKWAVLDPGELLVHTTANVTTALAVPGEGSILEYSTADGTIGPQWVNLTSGSIIYGDSNKAAAVLAAPGSSGALLQTDGSSVPAWLATGTSGQKLTATPMPKWIDDAWGVSIVINGGGSTITATTKGTIRIPWKVGLSGWELIADTTGDITLDLYVEDPSSTPASSNSKITSTEVPALANAQRANGACSSWTTAIVAGDYITVDVIAGSSDITFVTLSLWGNKLSTA